MKAKRLFFFAIVVFLGVWVSDSSTGVAEAFLHSFDGGSDSGASPQYGALLLDGSTLYGMTMDGGGTGCGGAGCGTIFKIETGGNNFTVLHGFTGATTDGANPCGGLTLSGSTLYGMTSKGGAHDKGIIFKHNIADGNHTILHSLAYSTSNGDSPYGDLTLSESILYGMTKHGGYYDRGIIFRYNLTDRTFAVLHTFTGGSSDGAYPYGGLTLLDSILYGMTSEGGSSTYPYGTIFKYDLSSSAFHLLHSFEAGATNGDMPYGNLTLSTSGSTLYGMTNKGGYPGLGTIFKIDTSGTGFQVLKSFSVGASEGSSPYGSLTLSGTTLYGMTYAGGSSGQGIIFKINTDDTDGSSFQVLKSFQGWPSEGSSPYGSLLYSGSILYGMTSGGGGSSKGTVFSYSPTLVELVSFAAKPSDRAVALSWETASEIDNVGFFLWRKTSKERDYTRITEGIIPAQGVFCLGAKYSYLDTGVLPGIKYRYQLEDVDHSGQSSLHGPVSATTGDIVAVDPTDDETVPARPRPSFSWTSEYSDRFRLEFSKRPDFKLGGVFAAPMPGNGKASQKTTWITNFSYTPKAKEWDAIQQLGKKGGTVYWRVVGKNQQGQTFRSEASHFHLLTGTLAQPLEIRDR